MTKGLDVCSQQGSIDWQAVKAAGVEFVIPRDGRGITLDDNGMDYNFLEYVKGAKAAGIQIPGVYHFIYVHSMEDALKNAQKAVENVRRAGLPKSTVIWCDQEEKTVIDAVKNGFNLTTDLQRKVTEIFCNYVLAEGYCTGVYLNRDYLYRVYGTDIIQEYDLWYEDHTNAEPNFPCLYRQVDWYGKVPGISVNVDKNDFVGIYTAGTAKPKDSTKPSGGDSLSKVNKYIAALKELGDGRYRYYNGQPNSVGCSEYTRQALVKAGIINAGETFHAGSGNVGVLADTSRFRRREWNPNILKEGHILWSQGYHVSTWDGGNGVYEAAPEDSHGICDNGKTGVGHWSNHTYRNCGNGTMSWTCIYEIIDSGQQDEGSKLLKSKEYVSGALKLLDRALAYKNQFPYNCGLLDGNGVTWGDCWNINPKTMVWSMVLGEPIWANQIAGEAHVRHVYADGIKASGLPDCIGDTIMNQYCMETTFRQMLTAKKAPCLLLINGNHMGAYLGDFERDGKIYNVIEFSKNAKLNGKMRSYVDEYGQRLPYKGADAIGAWNRCGYLTAFLDYTDWDQDPVPTPTPAPEPAPDPGQISDLALALEIYAGKWGNNPERQAAITLKYGAAKYDAAQTIVDHIVSAMSWYRTEIKIAEEILAGSWGNNPDRQTNITLKYGANAYRIAQGYVNSICAKEFTMNNLRAAYDVAEGILCGLYGNGEERKQQIIAKYGETVRGLAQAIVNDILK